MYFTAICDVFYSNPFERRDHPVRRRIRPFISELHQSILFRRMLNSIPARSSPGGKMRVDGGSGAS